MNREPVESAPPSRLAAWRGEIDRIDTELLRLWNERAALAFSIADWKRSVGLAPLDPARERAIVARALAGNAGPLDAAAVRTLFRHLLAEIRRCRAGAREAD